jgi:4-hydroxy-tetrahydrodipicolinate reductase
MKIAILGYGKLGKTIDTLALHSSHEVALKVTSSTPLHASDLANIDVAIEVSTPEMAETHIRICLDAGVPVVIGTTGWYHHLEELSALCHQKNGGMLHATNFSVGVNLFFMLNRWMAKTMDRIGGYEPSLLEIHHTEKKDAPSGTGITLANDLISAYPRKNKWVNQVSSASEELEIISQRIPEEPGTHVVTYVSDVDSISLVHKAVNREGFARGALLAAEWIVGKKGVFTMQDVLGLEELKTV